MATTQEKYIAAFQRVVADLNQHIQELQMAVDNGQGNSLIDELIGAGIQKRNDYLETNKFITNNPISDQSQKMMNTFIQRAQEL